MTIYPSIHPLSLPVAMRSYPPWTLLLQICTRSSPPPYDGSASLNSRQLRCTYALGHTQRPSTREPKSRAGKLCHRHVDIITTASHASTAQTTKSTSLTTCIHTTFQRRPSHG